MRDSISHQHLSVEQRKTLDVHFRPLTGDTLMSLQDPAIEVKSLIQDDARSNRPYIPPNKIFYTLRENNPQSLKVLAELDARRRRLGEEAGFRTHVLKASDETLPPLSLGEEYVVLFDTRYYSNRNFRPMTPPEHRTPAWGRAARSSVAITSRMKYPSEPEQGANPFERCAYFLTILFGRRQHVEQERIERASQELMEQHRRNAQRRIAGIHGQSEEGVGSFLGKTAYVQPSTKDSARPLGQVRPPGL